MSAAFSWCRLPLALGFALGIASSDSAGAQGTRTWSAEFTVGAATVQGEKFLNNGRAAARLSVADRLSQWGRVAAYAEAGYDWLGRFGLLGADPDLTCLLKVPGAGCAPPFPDVTGPSGSIGLLYTPTARVETRVGVGGAAYSVSGTRVGAAVGQLDAALLPAAHVGLVLGARYAVIPRYRHDRLTVVPVLVGLRLR